MSALRRDGGFIYLLYPAKAAALAQNEERGRTVAMVRPRSSAVCENVAAQKAAAPFSPPAGTKGITH